MGLVLCVPVFERLFDVAEMGVLMYGYILLLAFVPTLVIQMVKMVREKKCRKVCNLLLFTLA